MPTLTLDLPESAYRAALDLPPAERVRRAAAAFTEETETITLPSGSIPPQTANPETLARLRAQARAGAVADAALRAQWADEVTDAEAKSKAFEEHMRNINANREATGERRIY